MRTLTAQLIDPRGSKQRLVFALRVLLVALITSGCQSLPPSSRQSGGGPADDRQFGLALAKSIEAIAQSRHRPEALTRSEIQHRRLLASNLPRLLDEAMPERWLGGIDWAGARVDPGELDQIKPVLEPIVQPDTTAAGLARAGIGVPVVARLPAPNDPNAPLAGYHLPATLVAQPAIEPGIERDMAKGGPEDVNACCQAALVDPDAVVQVPTASGALPVAMDLHAPLKATKATGISPLASIANFLRPGRFTGNPRIVFLTPFIEDKTPVVLIHGLLSTPNIWEHLVTELLADPLVRECCQLWFFYYPTGQPVPLSALQLRNALNDAVSRTGLKKKIILVGHSMGGILARAQVSRLDPARAERILPGVSGFPEYSSVRQALIFEPRADVSRVMFLFVPHRGSRLATSGLGALGTRLIRIPDTLLNETEHALEQLAGHESRRMPTSIHGLSPNSAFLRALSTTTPSVPTHSIIGNRGRGDGGSGSDGVVPVRSARLASAESELIVPTGHGGFNHPAAVAEIKRIILMDATLPRMQGDTPEYGRAETAEQRSEALR